MLNKIKPNSEFVRNVLTLMTGTTIAQALPIVVSPILTRIYTPEDFGVFALFVAMSTIFGAISAGRYELAIMLPKKEEYAINIVALSFLITCLLSSVLFVLVVIFGDLFVKLLKKDAINLWLYLVPISVFLTGLWNILNYFNIRKKNYKDFRNATIIKSVILSVVQLLLGLFKFSMAGLILGHILSNLIGNIKLLKSILIDKTLISQISKLRMIALAKTYKNFPKYSALAILLNTMSRRFVDILISFFYGLTTLGFYSLTQMALAVPLLLISDPIGQVFFKQATEEKKKTNKAINTFIYTIKKLLLIGIPIFGILYFIIEYIFVIVFGEEWRICGSYAKLILPLFFIRFIFTSISYMDIVMEKQNINLLFNFVLFAVGTLTIVVFKDCSFEMFLTYFSIFVSLVYIGYGFVLYKMAK